MPRSQPERKGKQGACTDDDQPFGTATRSSHPFLPSEGCEDQPLSCDPKVLGEGLKMENSQKWSGEGAKGLLGQGGQRPVALAQKRAAPAQNRVLVVQKTLGRPLVPGFKTPFAPSPNHFGHF